jgi:hypothetical protein
MLSGEKAREPLRPTWTTCTFTSDCAMAAAVSRNAEMRVLKSCISDDMNVS